MPEVVREFVPDCRTLECKSTFVDQLGLYLQKGFETDECQRRNEAVGKEHKSCECRQGIEDQCK